MYYYLMYMYVLYTTPFGIRHPPEYITLRNASFFLPHAYYVLKTLQAHCYWYLHRMLGKPPTSLLRLQTLFPSVTVAVRAHAGSLAGANDYISYMMLLTYPIDDKMRRRLYLIHCT